MPEPFVAHVVVIDGVVYRVKNAEGRDLRVEIRDAIVNGRLLEYEVEGVGEAFEGYVFIHGAHAPSVVHGVIPWGR